MKEIFDDLQAKIKDLTGLETVYGVEKIRDEEAFCLLTFKGYNKSGTLDFEFAITGTSLAPDRSFYVDLANAEKTAFEKLPFNQKALNEYKYESLTSSNFCIIDNENKAYTHFNNITKKEYYKREFMLECVIT